jgi:hypothetical protein
MDIAYEEDFIDFIDAHASNMKAVRGFKRATVYVCDPDEDRGFEKHDKLHRTFYIYYEVDDEESLQKWIQNEVCSVFHQKNWCSISHLLMCICFHQEPKIIKDLEKLLKSDDEKENIVVDFRQVLNPLTQYKLSKQQKRTRAD